MLSSVEEAPFVDLVPWIAWAIVLVWAIYLASAIYIASAIVLVQTLVVVEERRGVRPLEAVRRAGPPHDALLCVFHIHALVVRSVHVASLRDQALEPVVPTLSENHWFVPLFFPDFFPCRSRYLRTEVRLVPLSMVAALIALIASRVSRAIKSLTQTPLVCRAAETHLFYTGALFVVVTHPTLVNVASAQQPGSLRSVVNEAHNTVLPPYNHSGVGAPAVWGDHPVPIARGWGGECPVLRLPPMLEEQSVLSWEQSVPFAGKKWNPPIPRYYYVPEMNLRHSAGVQGSQYKIPVASSTFPGPRQHSLGVLKPFYLIPVPFDVEGNWLDFCLCATIRASAVSLASGIQMLFALQRYHTVDSLVPPIAAPVGTSKAPGRRVALLQDWRLKFFAVMIHALFPFPVVSHFLVLPALRALFF